MLKCLKRLFCNHEYSLLTSYFKDGDEGVGYRKIQIFIIYCPKCGKKRHLVKHDYETVINQQRIDKEYKDAKRNRNSEQPK